MCFEIFPFTVPSFLNLNAKGFITFVKILPHSVSPFIFVLLIVNSINLSLTFLYASLV